MNHAPPPAKQRYRVKQPDPPTTPTPSTTDAKLKTMLESASRKRPADGSTAQNPRAAKRSKTNGASHQTFEDDWSAQIEEDEDSSSSEPELKNQVDPALQVCRYLLEMFSVPLLRSHATVSLVDRDRLQLYHANRSVILVSSAINFSDGDGKDKFIATIIAFHCLSLEQNGILETQVPRNAGLILKAKFPDTQVVQQGNELHFLGNGDPFTVELADVISRDPAMVGRSTLVIGATCKRWKGPLVVKISWPTSSRASETKFLERAKGEAKGEHIWVTRHLPLVHYAEDVVFSADSTLRSVAGLFADAKFVDKGYVYERRTLRIIIQELLYPLKSLSSVRDIGQVFLDVACGTCVPSGSWLPSAHHG